MMAVDKDYAVVVESWERALSALNQMVGVVEPGPQVWENISSAIGLSGAQASMVLPSAPEQVVATRPWTGFGYAAVWDDKSSARAAAPPASRCRRCSAPVRW